MPQPVKQPININFQQGLNTKVDPYQVPVGQFLSLVNSVFDSVGRLTKRNGFANFTTLPVSTTSYLTTFNDDLQAIGNELLSYSSGESKWVDKGTTYPVQLSTLPLVRNSLEQTKADIAVAPNGLVCTGYLETNGSVNVPKYSIADSVTGQNLVEPTALPSADSTYGAPRVFILGEYFVIIYTTASPTYALVYLAIPYNETALNPITGTLSTGYAPASTQAFDAVLGGNGSLYVAYTAALSRGVMLVSLTGTLQLSVTVTVDALHTPTIFSLAADNVNNQVWISYSDGSNGYTSVYSNLLVQVLAPVHVISSGTQLNLASTVQSQVLTLYWELANNYSYDSSIPSHYIEANTVTIGGTLGTAWTSIRSLGLASKAFVVGSTSYYLGAYSSPLQPTYFLIDGTNSTQASPKVVAKLAYSNGGGYCTAGLPNPQVSGSTVQLPYLYKDLLESQAPAINQTLNSPAPAIYTQTGVNMASLSFSTGGLASAEVGHTLQLTGGFLWSYDGFSATESGMFLWPDSVEASWSTTGGSIHAQPDGSTNTDAYYYQVVYEWTDNQGNPYRSAPSVPVAVTTSGSGSTGSIALDIPTLRLTYKTSTPVRIVIYRWSVANQVYYQVTSITAPTQNDLTTDSISYTDTLADASIVGNNIIYTTGGVVEDVNAPSSSIITLFDDRVWLVDAEDQNLLWFSKQVIESTPVEMSDLFTLYVAPSIGAQGSTGVITALAPMDDKLIIFKKSAIYFINGTGPDNTGANNNYSQPIFISSTVGCTNPRSIVMTPDGLMFQSDKGIWLLGRDLSTAYIGAPVEAYNSNTVTSALAVPATNQVRFGLDSGTTLMYDYYVRQWGTFEGIPSVSACLYNNLHTIVNEYGTVSQESYGDYIDGTTPVIMSFTTSWLELAGLRGYMRAYWFYFLGTYLSPHKLNVSVAYNYNSSPSQSNLITPVNYGQPYGDDSYYGGNGSAAYGGGPSGIENNGNIEQFRVFFQQQRCKAFQLTIQEVFDPTLGTVAGPGLTLSGLNCIVGLKKAYSPLPSTLQVG